MGKTDGSTPRPRHVVMPDALWDAVRVAAFDQRVSMSQVVREALEAYGPLAPYRGGSDG